MIVTVTRESIYLSFLRKKHFTQRNKNSNALLKPRAYYNVVIKT